MIFFASSTLNMNDSYYILDTFYERNWYQKYAHKYIICNTLSQPYINQMGYLLCPMLITKVQRKLAASFMSLHLADDDPM